MPRQLVGAGYFMVNEGECSVKEKRRRLLESIKRVSYRSLQRLPGEILSDFLQRLERSLIKVVHGGGLQVSAANTARV